MNAAHSLGLRKLPSIAGVDAATHTPSAKHRPMAKTNKTRANPKSNDRLAHHLEARMSTRDNERLTDSG
jgi:hypothetical protein